MEDRSGPMTGGLGSDTAGGPENDDGDGYESDGSTNQEGVSEEYQKKKNTSNYEVLMVAPRTRNRKKPLALSVLEAVAKQKATNTETILEPFGHRTFGSINSFMSAWAGYEKANYLKYRTRHSLTANGHNKIQNKKRVKSNKPLDHPAFVKSLVPIRMGYAIKTLRCTHGCIQTPRGDGTRVQASTRFTGCDARITAISRRLPTGAWVVQTVSEVIRHNHNCNEVIFDSYATSSLIEEHLMFDGVNLMVQANAPARNICDVFARLTGAALTPQQLANFRRDRLGGEDALKNLQLLLERFSSFSGSNCLVLEDQDKQICGIVMQSAAQRLMFEKYGDTLVLDWTHNTNNVGYYLGALMVTSVTGRGVSVLDFLCIEQTKDMMRAVFRHFIKTNPGAVAKLISVIIDKDYAEWAVLEELFPNTKVLLCQFHVLKWLLQVVSSSRFDLEMSLRESVMRVLRAMVYAPSTDAFTTQQRLLFGLLHEISPGFLEYMHARWYPVRRMWSNCERGLCFTAMNTTSNRIEASWGQVKQILGLKLRIDLCIEAVFTYQTSVLRREYRMISKFSTRFVLRSLSDDFIRPVLQQVSDYCAKHVSEQWVASVNMAGDYFAVAVATGPGIAPCYHVETMRSGSSRYLVDLSTWSCTCEAFLTSALPCRHLLFIARDRCDGMSSYPVSALPSRWLLNDAVGSLPSLRHWASEIQSLRTGLLHADASIAQHVEAESAHVAATVERMPASVAHVTLNRRMHADDVVLNNLEKRNVVRAEFEEITKYMMAQSTPRFKVLAVQLHEWLAGAVAAMRLSATSSEEMEMPLFQPDTSQTIDDAVDAAVMDDDAAHEAHYGGSSLYGQAAVSTHHHAAPTPTSHQSAPTPAAQSAQSAPTPAAQSGRCSVANQSGSVATLPQIISIGAQALPVPADSAWPTIPGREAWPRAAATDAPVVETTDTVIKCLATDHFVDEEEADHVFHTDFGIDMDCDDFGMSLSFSDASELLQTIAVRSADALQHPLAEFGFTSSADGDAKMDIKNKDSAANEARKQIPRDEGPGGFLTNATLRLRDGVGVTKKAKAASSKPGRLGYISQQTDCPVALVQFVDALHNTPDIARVQALWRMYPVLFEEEWLQKKKAVATIRCIVPAHYSINFVVPVGLLNILKHAVTMARTTEGPSYYPTDVNGSETKRIDEYVVTLAHSVRGFSEGNNAAMSNYYAIKSACKTYEADMAWLVHGPTEGFAENDVAGSATGVPCIPYLREFLTVDAGGLVDSATRIKMHTEWNKCSLRTRYMTSAAADAMCISTTDVIGFLAQHAWLNDMVLVYALNQMAADFPGVMVMDSIRITRAQLPRNAVESLPASQLFSHRALICPVLVGKSHWCLIFVSVDIARGIHVTMYDPLVSPGFESELENHWTSYYKKLLMAWAARDSCHFNVIDRVGWLTTPKQEDGYNCGVFCLAVAFDLANGTGSFISQSRLTATTTRDLRVRVMWRILYGSVKVDTTDDESTAAKSLAAFSAYVSPVAKGKGRQAKK